MFKKIFTIVVPVLAITAAILLFGIKVYNESYSTFQEDGYIISFENGKQSNKFYFLKENKYKVNETKNEVTFINTEDEEITIPNDSFVHYTDGSVATFKKAVVLNLANVKNSTLQYYNVYEGSVFEKASDGHQIDYLDQKLAFKDFLIKLTENKYMIVGKKITVKYGEEEKTISDGYLEVEYLDGNIIKISNQDLNVQNISKDLQISSDGITVDLINKKIIYDGETKVNLGEITIDSDDNIEIIPDEEKDDIEEDASLSVEHFEDQPITTPNVNIGGMQSGVVDTTTKRPDEIVEENETIKDAEFDVPNISVTPTSVEADIKIKDEKEVLRGSISWKIVENSTNFVVLAGFEDQGTTGFTISCSQLNPDTNYSIIVRSAYTKNDVNYEKDFVQKTFVTKTLGISIDKDYVTTEEVSFMVDVNGYSTIQAFYYDLIGPDGKAVVEKKLHEFPAPLKSGADQKVQLKFFSNDDYKIHSNSSYTLRIYSIKFENLQMAEKHKITKTLKTLKKAPKFGTSAVAINKQSSKFVIYLNNVSDPDNGTISYRADIYEKNKAGDKKNLITSRQATATSEIQVDIDEKIINRNVNYQANLYLTFYDNEMEYELYLGYVDMLMNSVQGPKVTFVEKEIKHDFIKGEITISDPNETLDLNREIYIISQNNSIGHSAQTRTELINAGAIGSNKTFTIAINDEGLKSNSTYTYSLMGWIDYKDNNGYALVEFAQVRINTLEPEDLNAVITNLTGEKEGEGQQFAIHVKMTETNGLVQGKNPHELNSMNMVRFRIYSDEYNPSLKCEFVNKCWELPVLDININDNNNHNSSLKETFYDNGEPENGAGKLFYPGEFGIMDTDMTYGMYYFEIIEATDYTKYPNNLNITGTTKITFSPNPTTNNIISTKQYTDTPIYNNKAIVDYKDPDLKSGTIIGYKIVPDAKLPTDIRSEYKFTYTIIDLTTQKSKTLTDSEVEPLYDPSVNDGNNAVALLFHKVASTADFTFDRGHSYAISYKIDYKYNGEWQDTETKELIPLTTQPDKEKPTIKAYLSNTSTVDGTQTWNYVLSDVDHAMTNDPTYGYSGLFADNLNYMWVPITCGSNESKDCLKNPTGSFNTKISSGSLLVRTNIKLRDGAHASYGLPITEKREDLPIIEEILYIPIITDTNAITYEKDRGANDISFIFDNYRPNVLSGQVVNVKVKLTSENGPEVILYKEFLDNGYENALSGAKATISISFTEIQSLMGQGTITPEISFLYDREEVGFDVEDHGEGYAIQETSNGAMQYKYYNSKYRIFQNVAFNFETGSLTFNDLEGNPYNRSLSHSTKGMYYGSNNIVNIKSLTNKATNCKGGADCTFAFSEIQPTLELEESEIHTMIGGVKMQPKLTINSLIEPSFELVARFYAQNADGTCGTTIIEEQNIDYTDSIKGKDYWVTKTDLETGKGYCVKFVYNADGVTGGDFFYNSVYNNNPANPTTREYKFTTLVKPQISKFSMSYDTGYVRWDEGNFGTVEPSMRQHDYYNRSLTTHFEISTLENYDGIDFEILNEEGQVIEGLADKLGIQPVLISGKVNTEVDFTFKIDASADFTSLLANTPYQLSILAYQNCSEGENQCVSGKRYLEATNEPFIFYIKQPTIKMTRIDNPEDDLGEFSLKVVIQDKFRAVGGYSRYNHSPAQYTLYIVNDSGQNITFPIESPSYTTTQQFKGIDHCKNSTNCTIRLQYEEDLTNTGVYTDAFVTKDISISNAVDIGQVSVISTRTDKITLGFTNSYMLSKITQYDYTISGNGASVSAQNAKATWIQSADGTYYTLEIKVGLPAGKHQLDITYKDEKGKMVASGSYDVIIG